MTEAAGFPKLVVEACCAFAATVASSAVNMSTSSNSNEGSRRPLVPTPSKVMQRRHDLHGSTSTDAAGGDGDIGGVDGIADDDDAFAAFALTAVRRHVAWILGDWRRGGIPPGTRAVRVGPSSANGSGDIDTRRVEPFCFWEEMANATEAADAMAGRAVLLRLWWSRREALDAHRALCHAASRVRLLHLEPMLHVPQSIVFACNGAMVSVTELTAVAPGFVHRLTANTLPLLVDPHAAAWVALLNKDVLLTQPAASGAGDVGGVIAVECPSSSRDRRRRTSGPRTSTPPLIRLVVLPAAHEVFAEALDRPASPASAAAYASLYQRRALTDNTPPPLTAASTAQTIANLVNTLVNMADDSGTDVDGMPFADTTENDQCGERCRVMSHLFHSAAPGADGAASGVNMCRIGDVRRVVLSKLCAPSSLPSSGSSETFRQRRSNVVWRALDERLLSGSVLPLLSRVVDDTAERTTRLPTEVKVHRESEAVEACLRRLIAAPESRLPAVVAKRYGARPFSDGSPPLHPSLLEPNSEALACLMCHCATLLGFTATAVQTADAREGTTPDPHRAWTVVVDRISLGVPITSTDYIGSAMEISSSVAQRISPAGTNVDATFRREGPPRYADLVHRIVEGAAAASPAATTNAAPCVWTAWTECLEALGSDGGESSGAVTPLDGDRMVCGLLLALASTTAAATGSKDAARPPSPAPPVAVLRGLRWLHSAVLSGQTTSTVGPDGGHDALRIVAAQVLTVLTAHFVEPLCVSPSSAETSVDDAVVVDAVVELACRCCLALLPTRAASADDTPHPAAGSTHFEDEDHYRIFFLRFINKAWDRHTSARRPQPAAQRSDNVPASGADGERAKQRQTQAMWLAVVVALVEAHMLHLVPIGDDTTRLKRMGLSLVSAAMMSASGDDAASGLLKLHNQRWQQQPQRATATTRHPTMSIARVLTQLLVELEHHALTVVATAVAVVLAKWVFRLPTFPDAVVQVLVDAATAFVLQGRPLDAMEPTLEALNTSRRLQPYCVAAAKDVLQAVCYEDRVAYPELPTNNVSTTTSGNEMLQGGEDGCMGALHADGIRALVVTALVRTDPSGLSHSFRAASLAGLQPQRPPQQAPPSSSKAQRSGGKPPRSRELSMVDQVFSRWHYFESTAARRRYAEEVLWGRTVNVLGSSATISEDDAEYYLLDFGLFGDLSIVDAEGRGSAGASSVAHDGAEPFTGGPTDALQFQHGDVGAALVGAVEHEYQRQAVLLALLLASARCVRKFGTLKPPIATRSKDAMSSVLATVVLILKRPDILMADLDDDEPVLLGLLDVAAWLASIQRPEERCLCRAVCLWIVRALLPFSSIASCCAPSVVDNVVALLDALDAWQDDPCLREAPLFMTEGAAESVMLLLDSFDDATGSFPAVSDTSRILGRTLSGFDEVRKSLDRQWIMGPWPPPPSSSRADGKKRVVSANAPRRLLSFDPMSAFSAAEESDRQTIAAEETIAFQQEMIAEHRRLVPRLFEQHLAHASHSSNVRVPTYLEVNWRAVTGRVVDEVEPHHRTRIVVDEAHAWGRLGSLLAPESACKRRVVRSPMRQDPPTAVLCSPPASDDRIDDDAAEDRLRNAQWQQRASIEKAYGHAFLALRSAAEMEAAALTQVLSDSQRAFYNPRTPTPPATPATPEEDVAAVAVLPRCLAEPLCDSEASGRSMLEATWKTYWGVLILDMKRCILLQRNY